MAVRRFPLLGKSAALAGVFIALSLALQSVSGIVAEREGRLREAERSVAASLASAQTLLGPVIERDCSEAWETTQGDGKDRKTVTERRLFKLERDAGDARRQGRRRHRAALPRHLQGQRLRPEGAPGRGLERRRDAAARGAAPRLAPALRCAGDVRRPRRFARRAQRGNADRRRRGAGARRDAARGASARLPRRRRRVVRRRAPAAARRGRRRARSAPASSHSRRSRQHPRRPSRRTGRTRRSPAASCRSSARSARPASAPAGSSTRWRRRRRRPLSIGAPACRLHDSRRRRRRAARRWPAQRRASRPSVSPSWTRSARTC